MILQRMRIIVWDHWDVRFEPGTSAPKVWCTTNEPPHLLNFIQNAFPNFTPLSRTKGTVSRVLYPWAGDWPIKVLLIWLRFRGDIRIESSIFLLQGVRTIFFSLPRSILKTMRHFIIFTRISPWREIRTICENTSAYE